jgi:hypothetical protein
VKPDVLEIGYSYYASLNFKSAYTSAGRFAIAIDASCVIELFRGKYSEIAWSSSAVVSTGSGHVVRGA